ncbi:MAG: nitroreductase family deazaflavin-dependent oxidoreductase [Ktedonobacterales bacterium]
MSTANPSRSRRTPAILRFALKAMVGLYRMTNGAVAGRMGSTPVLLLTTIGRKSGKPHTIPLSFFTDGDTLFLVASNGGSDRHPAWYLNLTAHPQVEIQVKGDHQTVTATTATPDERTRLWAQVVAKAANYARYAQRTTREIPIVLIRSTR